MEILNLTRGCSVARRRRSFSRDLRPETTTSARLTKVANPRASSRFSFGDRVAWHDEVAVYIREASGDPGSALVCLPDGTTALWPACLAGMRRVPTPGVEELPLPLPPASTDYYAALSVEGEDATVAEPIELDYTLPDGEKRWLR